MHELKFRGQRNDNGEWVYGSLVQTPNDPYYSTFISIDDSAFFDTSYAGNDGSLRVDSLLFAVINVGQFTGLRDKNGVEIYEGDYVRFDDRLREDGSTNEGFVSFDNGSFFIQALYFPHYRWADYSVEVIGNVHEHPDLLSEQTQAK